MNRTNLKILNYIRNFIFFIFDYLFYEVQKYNLIKNWKKKDKYFYKNFT
jgi:hypothetical protein